MFDSSGVPLIYIYITLWYYTFVVVCRWEGGGPCSVLFMLLQRHTISFWYAWFCHISFIFISDVVFFSVCVCIYFMLYRLCSRWFEFSLKFYEIMEFEFLILRLWYLFTISSSVVVRCLQCDLCIKVFPSSIFHFPL